MTENKTLQEFIDEKKQNFCNYLLQRFPKSEKIKSDVALYKSVNAVDFMVYIKENIQIYETDLSKFVDTKFSEYFVRVPISSGNGNQLIQNSEAVLNSNEEKLDKETHEKLVRYLQMFIDFCRS